MKVLLILVVVALCIVVFVGWAIAKSFLPPTPKPPNIGWVDKAVSDFKQQGRESVGG